MTRKFKSGDRVRVNRTTLSIGTVVDCDKYGSILVKFDNFTNGHSGFRFYNKKGIKHDPKNRQHLYVLEEDLCLLEGE